MNNSWVDSLGRSMIERIDISVGGNFVWRCTKCNKTYDEQPKNEYKCQNMCEFKTLNQSYVFSLLQSFGLCDIDANEFMQTKKTTEHIDKLFRDETSYKTEEEAVCGMEYDNFYDLIIERYASEIYDDNKETCNCTKFIYEKIPLHHIDTIHTNVTKKHDDELFTPLSFWFDRFNHVAYPIT